MKKTLLLASAAITTLAMQAKTVTPAQALSEASQFCQARVEKGVMRAPKLNTNMKIAYTNPDGGYYVVNRGNGAGYVIVAGDDCSPMILGYSNSGNFDYNAIPANKKAWLDAYAKQVAASAKAGITYKAESANDHAKIATLLKTDWGQDAPYSDICPNQSLDSTSNLHCPTGCVATAMAQVLNYHQWPVQAKGTGSAVYAEYSAYGTKTKTVNLPTIDMSGDTFAWDKMLNKYASNANTDSSGTAEQRAAVALLMRDCGYSVGMEYANGSSGIGSGPVPNAMIQNFGYDKGVHLVRRGWVDDVEWDSLVYSQLAAYGPVLYLGVTEKGEGHAFVCDGYNGEGYYHFNWGWDGNSNDYFLLSALNPKIQGTGGSEERLAFDYGQEIVAGVQKPQEGSNYTYVLANYNSMYPHPNNSKLISCTVMNYGTDTFNGELGLQVTNEATGESEFRSCDKVSIPVNSYVETVTDTLTLADGTYRLRIANKREGETKWTLNKVSAGDISSLLVTVKDGKKTYSSDVEFSYTDATLKNVSLVKSATSTFTATLETNGGTHTADLWYVIKDVTANDSAYASKTHTAVDFDIYNRKKVLDITMEAYAGYNLDHKYVVYLLDGNGLLANSDTLTVTNAPRFEVIDPLAITNLHNDSVLYEGETAKIHIKMKNVNNTVVDDDAIGGFMVNGKAQSDDGSEYTAINEWIVLASHSDGFAKFEGDTITLDGELPELSIYTDFYSDIKITMSYGINKGFTYDNYVLLPASQATVHFKVEQRSTGVDGVESKATVAKSEVYNLQGMLVTTCNGKANVKALPSGAYVVRSIMSDGTVKATKVIR